MKIGMEHGARTDSARSRRRLGATVVFLLGGAACVADNRLGLDDGDAGDPGGPYPVEAYGLTADVTLGQLAVATGSAAGPVTFLDAHDGTLLRVLQPAARTWPNVLMSAANGVFAVGDVSTSLFKSDRTLLREIPGAGGSYLHGPPNWDTAVALSADGAVLFTGDDGWLVRRIDVATGAEPLAPFAQLTPDAPGGQAFIASISVSPDGAAVAAGGWTGVRVWRVSDGVLLTELAATTNQVALSAQGELAVLGDGAVTFYAVDGTERGRYTLAGATGFAYSSDGRKLAVAGYQTPGSTVVKIVDRPSGVETASFFDPQQGQPKLPVKDVMVRGLAFVEQDTAIAVGWSDRRVTSFGVSNGLPIWSRLLDE